MADFCRRWGAQYKYMIVFDADSVMSGRTMVRMVKSMELHPEMGMIQTPPLAVNMNSLVARVQQFANHLYGPVFATGLHFWLLGDAQYWGHNAIIHGGIIGDNCLIMSYAHVAHDCHLGNHVVQTSYVGLAGETDVDDWAIIGGGSLAHQFCHIGVHAMIQGGSRITKDVPPYALAGRHPLSFCGLNNVGLRRRGFSNEQIDRIREIYRIIYNSGLNRSDACLEVEREVPPCIERDNILNFIRASKRGIIKFTDLSVDE